MKKIVCLFFSVLFVQLQGFAQRKCGIEAEIAALSAKDPAWGQKFQERKATAQAIADDYSQFKKNQLADRTSGTISAVPVIFHIIVNEQELDSMGGTAGILQRIDSQIAVLNRDYNRQNADSTLIPSGWKSRYASSNIHFGLAHTDPNGHATYGYELKISNYPFTEDLNNDYSTAKNAVNGLAAWDNTKYMNVWCINFSDYPGLLGITAPRSFTTLEGGADPAEDEGICITYLALGCQTNTSSLYFPPGGDYAEGRTLTHETGHFFEIWHTWGDDGGLCPWNGGSDDGLADTPPEGDAHYGNPPYTIPGGTINDDCQYDGGTNEQTIGIACLDYLNYTDDDAMHLFTTDQANSMAAMVLVSSGSGLGPNGLGIPGESYSLTQNPLLLAWPANTGVATVNANNTLNIYPNPASGIVYISFDASADRLSEVTVTNILGQEVANMQAAVPQKDIYCIDLSAMSKGIYFIKCNFASGSITRKILLQ
jgi:hypothetical protein